MAQLQQNGKTFNITEEIQSKYGELITLILATESMDDDERQYWFDIMPSMTDSQVDRLYEILETEKKKLEELEVKYQKEIKQLNEKHLIEWQEFQIKDSKKKVKAEEEKDKTTAKSKGEEPEDILDMLDEV